MIRRKLYVVENTAALSYSGYHHASVDGITDGKQNKVHTYESEPSE